MNDEKISISRISWKELLEFLKNDNNPITDMSALLGGGISNKLLRYLKKLVSSITPITPITPITIKGADIYPLYCYFYNALYSKYPPKSEDEDLEIDKNAIRLTKESCEDYVIENL
ncbi:MAG: hypothetical protein ACXW1W_14535 [Methylococcaceae bacterium]